MDGIDYHVGGLIPGDCAAIAKGNCSMDKCADAACRGIFTDDATLASLTPNTTAFQFASLTIGTPETPFPWKPGTRFAPSNVSWPPAGVALHITFTAPTTAPTVHQGVTVTVHYEMYQGVPILSKWLSITSKTKHPIEISGVHVELLAVTQPFSPLPLIQYPPAQRTSDSAGDHGHYSQHGKGGNDPYQGLLWVEKDQPHAAEVNWQDDAHVLPNGGSAPGAGEAVLNVSYSQL